MSEDDLGIEDVKGIVLTGRVIRRSTDDPRGPRYEVGGEASDGRPASVVCRFLPSGVLRIVTVYVAEEWS